ncbi:MAG: c-type cytochrome [Chloroflexi bacterium]|nr:c-type cytochrome [Chloroflexota bacterium]
MEQSASPKRTGSLALYVALLAAWTAMLGSLYFSEVRGFVPCALCWYQRILMYPLAGLIAFGILRRDWHLPFLVLPFSLLGQAISTYHYLIQKTTIFGAPTACAAGVPCTTVWINWLGFITIPFLAMIAFLIITVAMLTAYYSDQPDEERRLPARWPVFAIVAIALLVYGGVYGQAQAAKESKAAALPVTVLEGTEHAEHNPVQPAQPSPALEEGERLYAQACAACHGPDGAGIPTLGNTFVASEFLTANDDAEVLAMIRAGREPGAADNRSGVAMPASGGRPDLTDGQLAAIIVYIRNGLPQ